ncbi:MULTISPECIES: ABC transporter substrate-binding protein [unclassified Actinomyces]|uniref:ABC transporter substrate-binding protein n=1 Tax=unclassified Actinomyces TaxID=2609248 RepID=UPI000D597A78|nr:MULTISPECIES: ABC transporter substrate-binding protein [unclassified Actinomyces]RAX24175.1 carbohydrate ABC transporter substrate-binding protein [Actinomyces sp. Z3]
MTSLRKRVAALLAAVSTALALTACGGSSAPSGSIEVLSWWTSASESVALDTLVNAYQERNSDASVDQLAVVGGAGSQAHVTLAQRLARGDAPDVWQSLSAGNVTAWREAGVVEDVSSLFTDEVTSQLPEEVLASVTVGNSQYAAPLSVHRANILMFNRDVLQNAGIDEPGTGYSLDDLLADLGTLEEQGTTPLCIGGADSITTAGLFESVLLATVGEEGWAQIEADRFDWSGPQVTEALKTFGQLMDYTDPADADRTWDEAAGRLADGQCGFYQMNDGALTESEALAGSTTGQSPVSSVTFPGTEGTFLIVVDTFVRSSASADGEGADAFLATVLDPQVQTAVCEVKGCVPVRNDADVTTLTPYQQQAAADLRSQTVLNAISYGEVISPAMQDGFFKAVKNYLSTGDASASTFARILTERINEGAAGPNL